MLVLSWNAFHICINICNIYAHAQIKTDRGIQREGKEEGRRKEEEGKEEERKEEERKEEGDRGRKHARMISIYNYTGWPISNDVLRFLENQDFHWKMFRTKVVWFEGKQIMIKSIFKKTDFSRIYATIKVITIFGNYTILLYNSILIIILHKSINSKIIEKSIIYEIFYTLYSNIF